MRSAIAEEFPEVVLEPAADYLAPLELERVDIEQSGR